MDSIKITVSIDISIERIKDLLCCAFEGGIDYWALIQEGATQADMDKVGAEYYHEIPALGGELKVYDREDFGDTDDPQELLGVLNMEGMKKALQYMAEGTDKNGKDCPGFRNHWDWFMNENEDATTGDIFVQLAVMGEEVFA
jgi:hypothetical protein